MRLEENKNRNPFGTPDGYFEKLNKDIIEATSKTPSAPYVKKHRTISWWAKTLGYAAMLAIAIFVADAITRNDIAESNETTVRAAQEDQSLTNEIIDNILTNYPIDDYTFYCYLTNTDID